MWTLGIILLIYGTSSENIKCPECCHCVETSLLVNSSHPEMDLVDIMNMDENSITLDPTVQDRTKVAENDKQKNGTRGDGKSFEGRSEEMFTYQITCNGLRDLKPLWLQDLPEPTTQLIIQKANFQSVKTFQQILKATFSKLSKLTDFSIKNSIIQSQELQSGVRKEFLPFASILNPREEEYEVSNGTDCRHVQIVNLSNNTLTYLPSGLFHSCSNLQTLDLSDNLIKNLEDEIFHPLSNLLRLDLHRNRLKSLNEAVFRNLTKLLTLDVSQNKLSSVAPSTFQYLVSLNTLILSGNPLSTILVLLGTGKRLRIIDISKTGLRQIPGTLERSVRTLNLHGNLLTSIQCGDLDSYSLLSYLNLNNNRISYIADDAMGRLELLTDLQLSHNKLFQVPKSLPDNLETLNLSFNLIQNISSSDFTNLSLLKELSLSNNQIRQIEENSFVNLLKLRTLDLSWNPLLFVPPLQGLIKLRVLNLSYFTNISKDWKHTYKSFPTHNPGSIEVLSLESSPTLSQVFLLDTKTMQLYGNLTELHLRFSNLTTLRKDIFNLLPQLKILRLEGNPWHCDKEMLVISSWLRTHGVDISSSEENEINTMHCATPLRLYKKPLIALSFGDFEEHFMTSITPGIGESSSKVLNINLKIKEVQRYSMESVDSEERNIDSSPGTMGAFQEASTEPIFAADNDKAISDPVNTFTEAVKGSRGDLLDLTTESESVNVSKSAGSDFRDALFSSPSEEDSSTVSTSEFWEGDSILGSPSFWNETSNGTNVTDFDGGRQTTSEPGAGNGTADSETAETLRQVTASHPGLFVMMFVGVVMAATFAMALQQVTKARRDHGYRLQSQEMEVHSISSAANDLW